MDDTDVAEYLGLASTQVCLRDHDPRWQAAFEREAKLVRGATGDRLIDLQHYGSTSVPGIKAKPILDMLAGVARLDEALELIEPLAAIGYEFMPAAGVAEHHIFGKGEPRTHLLHFVEYGSPIWTDGLKFRELLRHDPDVAHAYQELKMQLAAQFASERAKYTLGKSDFITRSVSRP